MILLVQSFTARMSLLIATSAFGLGRRRWSSPQQCYETYILSLYNQWYALDAATTTKMKATTITKTMWRHHCCHCSALFNSSIFIKGFWKPKSSMSWPTRPLHQTRSNNIFLSVIFNFISFACGWWLILWYLQMYCWILLFTILAVEGTSVTDCLWHFDVVG